MKQHHRLPAFPGFAIAGLCVAVIAGCSQDQFSDLREFMATAGSAGQPPLESLPPVKPQEVFTYEPGDLADPFKPRSLKPAKGGGAFEPDLTRPRGPLEQHPLDSLRMVGTMSKGGQLYALVKTAQSALYRVKKGDYLGLNFGLVIGITDASIELRETVQDGVGDWTETKAMLALQE
jgi:type IV pilus assembly protein PilP